MIVTVDQFQAGIIVAPLLFIIRKINGTWTKITAHPIAKKKSGRDMKLFFSINLPSVAVYFGDVNLLFHVSITYEPSLPSNNTFALVLFK